MPKTLHSVATAAVYDDDIIRTPGMCQKFVRQCVQRLYGDKFDQFHKKNAKESAWAWMKSKYALPVGSTSLPGDILYWTTPEHGRDGHVAIRVPGNKVAENSTVHRDNENGSKGFRLLKNLDKPDLIIRLPQE